MLTSKSEASDLNIGLNVSATLRKSAKEKGEARQGCVAGAGRPALPVLGTVEGSLVSRGRVTSVALKDRESSD
jgi:hypothetical protein